MEEQRKSENALVPALRFEGFSDPWEQRKFLELVERRSRFSNDPALPRVEYEDIVSGQGMLNKDVIEKHDKRGGIAFEPGDVLYGKLRPYLQNWLNPQFKGIALGDFWVLNPTDISSGFLFVLIRTPTFERVANESTGTKMPRADWQNVSNTEFSIPLRKEEQEAIGALFQKLDSLIALHQRKHEKLKTVKQSLLEKMFPKEGEDVPEIRFEGFTDPWEQRKVGDYLVESRERGSSGDVAKKLTVKLWGKGVTEKAEISGSAHTQYYVRHAGQFIYSKLDFLNAAFGVIPDNLDEYESTADLPAFDVSNLDARFLLLKATQRSFYLRYGTIADGSRKAKRIHSEAFLAMPLFVPDYIEQTRIANLFARLDSLIALHQRELDILKNLKQALLEKMFV